MPFYKFVHGLPGILFLLLMLPPVGAGAAKTPEIVTTIRPIHSLVAGLTKTLTVPHLLIEQPQSPHHYQLKPSDIKKLNRADIVVYAGPQLETFMEKLSTQLHGKRIIAWTEIPGMILYPARALHGDTHDHGEHTTDGHLWLSIENAKIFVRHLRAVLTEMDERNAAVYRHNAELLIQRLEQRQQTIRDKLSGLGHIPFLQFHDAFQYFEREFGLGNGHFFTSGTEHKIGVRQLREIRRQIIDGPIHCVFYEPPNVPPVLRNLSIPHTMELQPLEPIGWNMKTDTDLYFHLMDNVSHQLEVCLKRHK